METDCFRQLAIVLDQLPQGYLATQTGVELKILKKLFTPEEACLAARLTKSLETVAQLASRLGMTQQELLPLLKTMLRKGLIKVGRIDGRTGFGLMPFVVGIYEMQAGRLDVELAQLFEEYYQGVFGQLLRMEPLAHRVIPVHKSLHQDLEIAPFNSALEIIESAKAWGVLPCICRNQKALIGQPCKHPLDVCLVISDQEGAFHTSETVQSLDKNEAIEKLDKAARAGLVHSVSNTQEGLWYICNCCTCSCGFLRGIAEFGYANVIARSAYVCQVDEELCIGCGVCIDTCQFGALDLQEVVHVDRMRCVGCGQCVLQCPQEALQMIRRPAQEVKPPLRDEVEWGEQRLKFRSEKPAD